MQIINNKKQITSLGLRTILFPQFILNLKQKKLITVSHHGVLKAIFF